MNVVRTTYQEHTDHRAEAPSQAHVVHVAGDLDMHHADEVRTTLFTEIAQAPPRAEVVLDLRHSSFCDSSGLNVLLDARRQAMELGHTLRLGAPCHQLLRLMETTETARMFTVGPVA
ncbi:STAS domain-containing protein [Streptomyces sp. NPDC056543]|uniref:STAS domain-containing protein n=1 Tax=unclassified Streptomyces TaxID=2593676 RepID=UPI0036A93E7E